MIWRIRERSAFQRIAEQGRRARAGVLWCTYILDPPGSTTPPRVAFAIGRALGSAVQRNQVRRRMRELLRAAASDGSLPSGEFLVGATPAAVSRSSVELAFDLESLLGQVRR